MKSFAMWLLPVFILTTWTSRAVAACCELYPMSPQCCGPSGICSRCKFQEQMCAAAAKTDPVLAKIKDHLYHCSLLGDGGIEVMPGLSPEEAWGLVEGMGDIGAAIFIKPEQALGKTIANVILQIAPLVEACNADPVCKPTIPGKFAVALRDTPEGMVHPLIAAVQRIDLNLLPSQAAELMKSAPAMAMHVARDKVKQLDCLDAESRGKVAAYFLVGGEAGAKIISKFPWIARLLEGEPMLAGPVPLVRIRAAVAPIGQRVVTDTAALNRARALAAAVVNTLDAPGAGEVAPKPKPKPVERRGVAVHADTSDDPSNPWRDLMLRQDASLIVTTPAENQAFINEANNLYPKGDQLFVGAEAAESKAMNQLWQEKKFTDAVINRYKRVVLKGVEDLKAQYPDLKVFPYSDFKGIHFLFEGKIPPGFAEKVDAIYQNANRDFVKYLTDRKILRATDRTSTWFRMAHGKTFDLEALASRMSRKIGGDPQAASLEDAHVYQFATDQLHATKDLETQIAQDPKFAKLVETVDGVTVLRREVFDLARKAKKPELLERMVQTEFHLPSFNRADAENVLSYVGHVDDFPPALLIPQRVIVNLDRAVNGGFTIDLLGVGSRNLQATAAAVAKSNTVEEIAVNSRLGERAVTGVIQDQLSAVRQIAGPIAKTSGDDSAGAFKTQWTQVQKQKLLDDLARDPRTGGQIRMAFIPPGVSDVADRTMIATHGESIENFMRMQLRESGEISTERLRSLTFAIDMRAQQAGQGVVDVMAASNSAHNPPTEAELRLIRAALERAVQENNALLSKNGVVVDYSAAK